MKKPVFPLANVPGLVRSTFKVGRATRPSSQKRLIDPVSIAPMRAVAVCKSCSLPSTSRRGKCTYCGSLLWTQLWPSGWLPAKNLLVVGLLLAGVLALPVPEIRIQPPSLYNLLPANPLQHLPVALPKLPSWQMPQGLPLAKPSSPKPSSALIPPANALPASAPTAPQQAALEKPLDAPQPSAIPASVPLTCGGFPAAGQPEPDFGPYLANVQGKIRAHWHPPVVDQPKHVVVLYRIACDGHLVRADVKTSSGLPVADQAALSAVKAAAPFPALPMNYVGRNVDVEFDFDYEMAASRKAHTPLKK